MVKKDFPLPEGPRMNLFLLVMMPFSWAGRKYPHAPVSRSGGLPAGCRTDWASSCNWSLRQRGIRPVPERYKGFFGWKVACISGDSRPIDDRCVNGVIPWRAFHHGQLAARVVPDAAELFRILRPGDDVAVASDGKHSFGMCLIKIHLRPLLVNGIAPAVF